MKMLKNNLKKIKEQIFKNKIAHFHLHIENIANIATNLGSSGTKRKRITPEGRDYILRAV